MRPYMTYLPTHGVPTKVKEYSISGEQNVLRMITHQNLPWETRNGLI